MNLKCLLYLILFRLNPQRRHKNNNQRTEELSTKFIYIFYEINFIVKDLEINLSFEAKE